MNLGSDVEEEEEGDIHEETGRDFSIVDESRTEHTDVSRDNFEDTDMDKEGIEELVGDNHRGDTDEEEMDNDYVDGAASLALDAVGEQMEND